MRAPEAAPKLPELALTGWRSHGPVSAGIVELELPSGQNVLIRPATMTQLVQERVFIAAPASSMLASDSVRERLVCALVLKPELKAAPRMPRDRKPNVAYVDVVSDEDRDVIIKASGVLG